MCKEAREKPHDRNATESARAVKEAPAIIENIIKDLESGKLGFMSWKKCILSLYFFINFFVISLHLYGPKDLQHNSL